MADTNPHVFFTKAYWQWCSYNDPRWLRALYVFMFILGIVGTVFSVIAILMGHFSFGIILNPIWVFCWGYLAWPTIARRIPKDYDETSNT